MNNLLLSLPEELLIVIGSKFETEEDLKSLFLDHIDKDKHKLFIDMINALTYHHLIYSAPHIWSTIIKLWNKSTTTSIFEGINYNEDTKLNISKEISDFLEEYHNKPDILWQLDFIDGCLDKFVNNINNGSIDRSNIQTLILILSEIRFVNLYTLVLDIIIKLGFDISKEYILELVESMSIIYDHETQYIKNKDNITNEYIKIIDRLVKAKSYLDPDIDYKKLIQEIIETVEDEGAAGALADALIDKYKDIIS